MTPWLHQLRKIAEGATQERWEADHDNYLSWDVSVMGEAPLIAEHANEANALHIARFDPPTVKLLLDVVEAAETHIKHGGMMNAQRVSDALTALRRHLEGG